MYCYHWSCVCITPSHYRSSFSCKNQCIQSNNSLYDLTDCFSHQSIWALSYQRLKTKHQNTVYQLWPWLFWVNSFSQMSLRGPASAAAVFPLGSDHTQHSALGASCIWASPFSQEQLGSLTWGPGLAPAVAWKLFIAQGNIKMGLQPCECTDTDKSEVTKSWVMASAWHTWTWKNKILHI